MSLFSISSVADLLKESLMLVDGKGGGNPSFAQGGAPTNTKVDELIAYLRNKIL